MTLPKLSDINYCRFTACVDAINNRELKCLRLQFLQQGTTNTCCVCQRSDEVFPDSQNRGNVLNLKNVWVDLLIVEHRLKCLKRFLRMRVAFLEFFEKG